MMSKSYLGIRKYILSITLLAIVSGLIIPEMFVKEYILWGGVLLIIGGIPHGASDYLIFRQLWSSTSNKNRKIDVKFTQAMIRDAVSMMNSRCSE